MATYEQYPTPPPTSSPKHASAAYQTFSPKLPAQDTYYQDTQPKLPAQDTYYKQSYSTPASPTHWDPSSHPPNDHVMATTTTSYDYLPPRRKSSPIQTTSQPSNTNSYYNPSAPQRPSFPQDGRSNSGRVSPNTSNPYPQQRPASRTKARTPPPRPIYFSPTNPLPTPYNATRPAPRPGFIKRMLAKISSWLRSLMKWAKKNPIKAGLASFLPLLAGAGLVKGAKALGLGKLLGEMGWVKGLSTAMAMVGGGVLEGMGGGKERFEKAMGKKEGKLEKEIEKGAEKIEEKKQEWGWGLDHFVGFGGTKAGPLDGVMKVLLMGVNHYCKLTPSAVPRAASILLELYFLEARK